MPSGTLRVPIATQGWGPRSGDTERHGFESVRLLFIGRHFSPAVIRIKALHRLRQLFATRPQVFFEDLSLMADHEAHHPGFTVFRWPGDQCKAPAHLVPDEVAVGPARCGRPLAQQDAEAVAMPGLAGYGFAELGPQRADLSAIVVRPIESVVLAGGTEDFLRVFEGAVTVAIHRGVVHLGIVIGQRRLHRGQLVAANLPGTKLRTAGLDVETPTLRAFYDGDRQCPVLTAHRQNRLVVAGFFNLVLLVV